MTDNARNDRRLRFHPLVTAYISLLFIIVGITQFYLGITGPENGDSAYWLSYTTGGFIAYVLMFIIPTGIIWAFSRSRQAVNITAVIMTSLLLLAITSSTFQEIAERGQPTASQIQAARNIAAATDHNIISEIHERSQAGEDVSQEVADRLQYIADNADELAESGKEIHKAMAMMSKVMLELQPTGQKQLRSNHQYVVLGGADPQTLPTVASIDERLAILDQLIVDTQQLKSTYAGLESKIRDGLDRFQLSAYDKKEAIAGWKSGAQPEIAERLQSHELQLYAIQRKVLVFLKKNFDDWELNANQELTLATYLLIEQYNTLIDQSDAESQAMESLQQELMQRIEQR